MVQLRTLGRLELVRGEPTALHVLAAQPKPLALLAYLALATPRGQHSRDALLALFWPELGADEARRALRQTLHRVRYHVGDALLKSERDGQIGISDDGAWCDAITFEQALEAGRHEQALSLYHGAFLDGVFVSDASAEFEQWVDLTRARLASCAAQAAATLASESTRLSDSASAVSWATLASQLAPEDEALVRKLMSSLAANDDRAGALRVFKSFADRMQREYEAEPAKETALLAAAMRAAPAAPPAPVAPAQPQPVVERPAIATSSAPAQLDSKESEEAVPLANRSHQRSNTRWRWGAAGLVAAALLLVGAISARRGHATPSSVDRILVADFQNHTRDSLLSGAITEAMRADLSQSRGTRVMSRTQVQAVLEHMRQPTGEISSESMIREVAERYGVKAFVTGDVSALGPGYSVSAELIAVKSGETLVSVREVASDSSKLLAVVDKVSDRLRHGIGESLWTVRASPPLEQVTTTSLQALRLYSQAIRVGDQEGDTQRAIQLLRQAVALDTSFAMAYRRLGVYLDASGVHAAAYDALARAFHNRMRLPEPERYNTAGSYFTSVALPDSAIATYRTLLALYPTDMRGIANLGAVYMNLCDFVRAESLYRRAIETDSTVARLFNHLATAQFNGGRYAEAERTLVERARRFPSQQDDGLIEISLQVQRGSFDTARVSAQQLLLAAGTDPGGAVEPLKALGTLALIDGHLGGIRSRFSIPGVAPAQRRKCGWISRSRGCACVHGHLVPTSECERARAAGFRNRETPSGIAGAARPRLRDARVHVCTGWAPGARA